MSGLKRLCQATNEAIEKLQQAKIPGAINWADLSCVEASSVTTDEGETYLQVTIEEASPAETGLQAAVAKDLEERGWPGVLVVTEW
jgi:hypothetical protein